MNFSSSQLKKKNENENIIQMSSFLREKFGKKKKIFLFHFICPQCLLTHLILTQSA